MSTGPSLSSSPTLPLTVDPIATLPDLSSADESEARTEVMPHRAWITHLSRAGERPAAAPQLLDDGEYRWLDDHAREVIDEDSIDVEIIDAEADLEIVRAEATHHAERAYVAPIGHGPAPVEAPRVARRRLPPLRVWLAVVLLGAGIGSAGGLTAAAATAPTPAVCPDPTRVEPTEPASDVAATNAVPTTTAPAEPVPMQATAAPSATAPRVTKTPPGFKNKGAPKRHLPR